MKKMYWRPRKVSRIALLLISAGAIAGHLTVENLPTKQQEPNHQEKMAAAQLALDAFKVIKAERLKRNLPVDPESDPAQTGLLGSLVTPVTTNAGSLASKQTAANPNFAAVAVQFLKDAGVNEGDLVAVGFSGSFPAINVAVLAAIDTLKLKPIIISSASSSQWGANEPEFLWLDMEQTLHTKGLISTRSIAASIGGIEDRGLGMTKKGRRFIEDAIKRHGIQQIDPKDFNDSIDQRMRIYRQVAGARPIRVYINVGGGTISVGRKVGKKSFKPGLNKKSPTTSFPIDSVMGRFIRSDVPVIHFTRIKDLAARYDLPQQPASIPPVGEGAIFYRKRPNRWLVTALLLAIVGLLYLFVRSDLGFRMTRGSGRSSGSDHPEPMV